MSTRRSILAAAMAVRFAGGARAETEAASLDNN